MTNNDLSQTHECEFCTRPTTRTRGGRFVCAQCSSKMDDVKKSENLDNSLGNRLYPADEDLNKSFG